MFWEEISYFCFFSTPARLLPTTTVTCVHFFADCTEWFHIGGHTKSPICPGIDVTSAWFGSTASHPARLACCRDKAPPQPGLTPGPAARCPPRVALAPTARPHRYYCEFCGVLPFIADKTLPWKGRRPCPAASSQILSMDFSGGRPNSVPSAS